MQRVTLLALLAAGCSAVPLPPGSPTLPPGQWGGDQVGLVIGPDGSGRIEMSCASAEFDGPVSLDSGGHFLVAGRFRSGTGVAMIDPPPPVAANISGRLDGPDDLWLDIALRDSYPLRNARLRRGREPALLRCL